MSITVFSENVAGGKIPDYDYRAILYFSKVWIWAIHGTKKFSYGALFLGDSSGLCPFLASAAYVYTNDGSVHHLGSVSTPGRQFSGFNYTT